MIQNALKIYTTLLTRHQELCSVREKSPIVDIERALLLSVDRNIYEISKVEHVDVAEAFTNYEIEISMLDW